MGIMYPVDMLHVSTLENENLVFILFIFLYLYRVCMHFFNNLSIYPVYYTTPGPTDANITHCNLVIHIRAHIKPSLS